MKVTSDKMLTALQSTTGRIADPPEYLTKALTIFNVAKSLGWGAVKDFGYRIDVEFMFVTFGIFDAQERKSRQDRLRNEARSKFKGVF